MSVIKRWITASYTVHEYYQRHMVIIMHWDKGAISSFSTKKKIKGKSSKEDDLIGVDNKMSKILWSKYFMKVQGYKIEHTKLLQDNKSYILLEK